MNKMEFFKPSLEQSWIMVGLFFAGSILFGGISAILRLCFSITIGNESLSYAMSMIVPMVYIYVMAGKSQFEEPLPLNSPDFGHLGVRAYMVLVIVGMLLLGIIVEPFTSFIPMSDFWKKLFEDAFMNSKPWDNILSACILAPLCEEFLCRGMMMRGMLQKVGPKKAILWSALIFAVMHMNPWQSIPAFILGIFLGWTYYRSGSLWVPIVLHCINNSCSTLLSHMLPDMEVDDGLIDMIPFGTYIAVYLISAAVFAVVINILRKNDEKTLSA